MYPQGKRASPLGAGGGSLESPAKRHAAAVAAAHPPAHPSGDGSTAQGPAQPPLHHQQEHQQQPGGSWQPQPSWLQPQPFASPRQPPQQTAHPPHCQQQQQPWPHHHQQQQQHQHQQAPWQPGQSRGPQPNANLAACPQPQQPAWQTPRQQQQQHQQQQQQSSPQQWCQQQPSPPQQPAAWQQQARSTPPCQAQQPPAQQQWQQQQQWQPWHGPTAAGAPPDAGTSLPDRTKGSGSRLAAAPAAAWLPSIWGRVRRSRELQAAVVGGRVQELCQALQQPAWHIGAEVSRLQAWFRLTFWFRLVLEQFMVLDFVSTRTLTQLPLTPPHELHQLDSWLGQDLAAYRAAAAAAASAGQQPGCNPEAGRAHISSSGSLAALPGSGPLTSWAQLCGGWVEGTDPSTWQLPPSRVIWRLLEEERLVWVPHSNLCAADGCGGAGAGGGGGSYQWQHGPADAWLSTDKAGKQQRAEQLVSKRHLRNQGRLVLSAGPGGPGGRSGRNPTAAAAAGTPLARNLFGAGAGSSSSSSSSWEPDSPAAQGAAFQQPHNTVQQQQASIGVDWRFLDSAHTASCHLQRHPVLGAHERLLKVSVDRSSVAAFTKLTSGSGSASKAAQGGAGVAPTSVQLLQDALSNGVWLAGRLYRRLVQKEVGQAGESLWFLATESVAPEDAAAWQPTNPAAARQCLASCSSLPTIAKQSARGALLVSNTLPLKVAARLILYIPDVQGPTDARGAPLQPDAAAAGSSSSSSSAVLGEEAVLTDGSGFIAQDLAELVPAVSAGELLTDRGQAVKWPHTPLQIRLFDPHCGVIAKGTLLPLNSSAMPPGAIVLRTSQVKAPAGRVFLQRWQQHWQRLLVWAHAQHQRRQPAVGADAASAAAAAAAQAAAHGPRAATLRCFHAQDQPWIMQLWYLHDALQLLSAQAPQGPVLQPPVPCQEQQQQPWCAGQGCASHSSSRSSSCRCSAVLEVVTRPLDVCGRPSGGDIRLNKNLLLLLHARGVPQSVFEDFLKIEQHQLVNIDASFARASAAARDAQAIDVVHKLDALMGLKEVGAPGSGSISSAWPGGGAWLNNAAAAAAAGAASTPAEEAGGLLRLGGKLYAFRPDLALKQELHDIKVKRRLRLANMTLTVPSPQDAAEAAAAGVVEPLPDGSGAVGTATAGVRMFGLPDPTCGAVPEGCVAVRPELVPPGGSALIYRDPGIHPGDVRRVRVVPYPPQLLRLLPEGTNGAMFLPSVGDTSLASKLAGGDYDGDLFLLLWEPRILATCTSEDPPPYVAPAAAASSSWGAVAEGAGWQVVEQQLTAYYWHCHEVSGLMGEAHNLWELLADRHGAAHGHCQELAGIYYRALDAPKTGACVRIPCQLQQELSSGGVPPWHSRAVKEAGRVAAAGGRSSSSRRRGGRPWPHPSKVVKHLFDLVRELPPMDFLDPALLELDPDLILQEGPQPEASAQEMAAYVAKWDRLHGHWTRCWREVYGAPEASPGKAGQQQKAEEMVAMKHALMTRLEQELWTGPDGSQQQQSDSSGLGGGGAAAAGIASLMTLHLLWRNASACYQAVYRHAQEKQRRLALLPREQLERQAQETGYSGAPRVAMPWRVAGQWLRTLKVLRPVLRALSTAAAGAPQHGGLQQRGGRAGALQLGSMQHPLLAQVVEAQQLGAAGRRRWGAADAAATMQGLRL